MHLQLTLTRTPWLLSGNSSNSRAAYCLGCTARCNVAGYDRAWWWVFSCRKLSQQQPDVPQIPFACPEANPITNSIPWSPENSRTLRGSPPSDTPLNPHSWSVGWSLSEQRESFFCSLAIPHRDFRQLQNLACQRYFPLASAFNEYKFLPHLEGSIKAPPQSAHCATAIQ